VGSPEHVADEKGVERIQKHELFPTSETWRHGPHFAAPTYRAKRSAWSLLLEVLLGNLGNLLTEKSVTLVQGTDGYCQIIAYPVL